MESVQAMLLDPLKGKNRAQNALAYLFREVLLWRKIGLNIWNKKIESFFNKPHNADYQDRGNFNKAIKADNLQWGSFKKGIDLLDPYHATLSIILIIDNVEYVYSIILDPAEDESNPTTNKFDWQTSPIFKDLEPSDNLLSHLVRHIYVDQAKGSEDPLEWFKSKIDEYMQEPRNILGFSPTEITTFQNTLKKDIMDSRISWNKLRRALHVLVPQEEQYEISLQWTKDNKLRKQLADTVIKVTHTNPFAK